MDKTNHVLLHTLMEQNCRHSRLLILLRMKSAPKAVLCHYTALSALQQLIGWQGLLTETKMLPYDRCSQNAFQPPLTLQHSFSQLLSIHPSIYFYALLLRHSGVTWLLESPVYYRALQGKQRTSESHIHSHSHFRHSCVCCEREHTQKTGWLLCEKRSIKIER